METCTSCGHTVTGKKFCPECGTPVQAAVAEVGTTTCPRCAGTVKADAAFCMHCGTSLSARATAIPTAASQPATHQCIACHAEVPASSAFCTNCGQSMQSGQAPVATAAPGPVFCTSCGAQSNAGSRFCNSCGQSLTAPGAPALSPQTGPYQPYTQQPLQYSAAPYSQQPAQYPAPTYGQPATQYPPQQPYGQPSYAPGYQGQAYGQNPYSQNGYPQTDPMLGQQSMVLRCPVCMAMAPVGTPQCVSCHTNLAGVVPTPSTMPMQGQQQGGLGGMLQGNAGKYAVGALGGAAAVLGGEMLLHGVENDFGGGGYNGYEPRRREGLLGEIGELGGLGNDIGLF